VKTCEDVAPSFGENRPGYFTMTTPRLHPAGSDEIPNGCHPPPTVLPGFGILRLLPVSKMKLKLKGRRFDSIEDIQAES
jgi:hypothetical protein